MNYSYQPEPEPEGFDISELNLPSQHHFNIGAGYNGAKWLGNVGVSYQSSAFWQDVLDSRFHGPTDGFTMTSGTVGYKWRGDRLVTSLKVTNLFTRRSAARLRAGAPQIVGELRLVLAIAKLPCSERARSMLEQLQKLRGSAADEHEEQTAACRARRDGDRRMCNSLRAGRADWSRHTREGHPPAAPAATRPRSAASRIERCGAANHTMARARAGADQRQLATQRQP